MRSFRTYELAVSLYQRIVKIQVPSHLKDQVLRASSSVVLNIAEGAGRTTMADKRRVYSIAMGSLRETRAVLDLVAADVAVRRDADVLTAHLYKLMQRPGP